MDATLGAILTSIVVASLIVLSVKLLNLLWFRPKKLQKLLREQGLNGNPYRPVLGDLKDFINCLKAEQPKSIGLSDDILPHVFSYYYESLTKYGENSFVWWGPWPRLNITDPEMIKEILSKPDIYEKPLPETTKILAGGLTSLEGEMWSKHRKILSPAFHMEKLKNMVPTTGLCCSDMIHKLEEIVSSSNKGWSEIDMWPYLDGLTGDIISRTAFGSSREEGEKIFRLQREKLKLSLQMLQLILIPGWRHLPLKVNRKLKAISSEVQSLLRGIVEKRHKVAMESGVFGNDLLGILMESNSRFMSEEEENVKNAGMSIEDVIEECKLFYLAGSETSSSLLVWTMVMLCRHPEWQTQAREEVNRVFGNSKPSFQMISQLKIVTMVLQEVLRLYTPVPLTTRANTKTVKLGNLTIPTGVHMTLLLGLVHRDPKIWGEDANEFNPQRFSEGVYSAAKVQSSFFPFSSGPRVCLGYNFSMIESKIALAMILQNFSFQLSPSYLHAPFAVITIQPQYGAPIILQSLQPLSGSSS